MVKRINITREKTVILVPTNELRNQTLASFKQHVPDVKIRRLGLADSDFKKLMEEKKSYNNTNLTAAEQSARLEKFKQKLIRKQLLYNLLMLILHH
jgi:hypothetical protein